MRLTDNMHVGFIAIIAMTVAGLSTSFQYKDEIIRTNIENNRLRAQVLMLKKSASECK